jgi:hypothetical protein
MVQLVRLALLVQLGVMASLVATAQPVLADSLAPPGRRDQLVSRVPRAARDRQGQRVQWDYLALLVQRGLLALQASLDLQALSALLVRLARRVYKASLDQSARPALLVPLARLARLARRVCKAFLDRSARPARAAQQVLLAPPALWVPLAPLAALA